MGHTPLSNGARALRKITFERRDVTMAKPPRYRTDTAHKWRQTTEPLNPSRIGPSVGPMHKDTESISLNGKLLVAMPSMGDPRFERSVVFICSHSDEGAMGLIVNKIASDLKFSDLLEQLDIPMPDAGQQIKVHVGGPV